MAKTNFTKVDEILKEELRRYAVDDLLAYSDWLQRSGNESQRQAAVEQLFLDQKKRRLLGAKMRWKIDRLFLEDRQLYTHLGTHHDEVTSLLEKLDELTEEQLERLKAIDQAIGLYEAQHQKPSKDDDENKIKKAREQSKRERFNVRSHWLPL